MILLGVGAEMLARLMRVEDRGPDTRWLLAGPSETAAEPPAEAREEDWPIAVE